MNTKTLFPSESMNDFYEIANFNNYLVSKKGQVFSKIKGQFLKGSVNPDGYHNFRLTNDLGYTYTYGLHRLLADVFIEKNNLNDNVVNHIDGNKRNNNIENLEWTTYTGNIEHAGLKNLTEKCLPITVRDSKTGEINFYPSMAAYSRIAKCSKDTVNWRVSADSNKIWPDGKQYKSGHYLGDWDDFIEESFKVDTSKRNRPIITRNFWTNKIQTFKNLIEFAKFLDISPSTLSIWLKDKNQPIMPNFLQVRYADTPGPWRPIEDVFSEINNFNNHQRLVYVFDENNCHLFVYSSISLCKQKRKIKHSTMHFRLMSNGEKVFSDGCKYSYECSKFLSNINKVSIISNDELIISLTDGDFLRALNTKRK